MNNVRNAIDKSVSEREKDILNFEECLQKDIAELKKEVKSLKQQGQVINSYIVYINDKN